MKGLKITKSREIGITLIALVVTIIVLIILATVSISMVAGENGLIKKAEESRESYENSAQREDTRMNEMLKEMAKAEGIIGPNGLPTVNTLTEIQMENVKAEDKQGNKITVPKGFKVKTEYGTSVEKGIVIEDDEGNQFVWVPCKEDEYVKHNYVTQKVNDTTAIIADEGNENWKTYKYRQYTDWKDDVDIGKNKESVKNNGGFYIGRYEAGVPNNASFYVEKDTETKIYNRDKDVTQEEGINLKPVSKSGNQCWNCISQVNAKVVSENMYKAEGENNEYGVRSQLIDGIAWDVVTNWITKEDEKKVIINDSTNYGNYINTQMAAYGLNAIHTYVNGSWVSKYDYGDFKLGGIIGGTTSKLIEMATGLVDEFKLKNIYDFAGNMWEKTTEVGYHDVEKISNDSEDNRQKYAVIRGGSLYDKRKSICRSNRLSNNGNSRRWRYY